MAHHVSEVSIVSGFREGVLKHIISMRITHMQVPKEASHTGLAYCWLVGNEGMRYPIYSLKGEREREREIDR